MTQKNPNIPMNGENENINTSTESTKDNQNQRQLISEAIGQYYKKNPQEVLAFLDGSSADVARFKKELLKESNLIKGKYTGGLGNVSSSALDGFIKEEDITIRKEILSISIPRKNLERIVWKTCIDRYPLGSLSSHIHDIQNKIKLFSTIELNNILKNRKLGHEKLINPVCGNTIIFRDANSIINDLSLQNNEVTQSILGQYTESGKIKSKDLVNLLETHNALTVRQKKIILSFFRPSLTVAELETYGIYSAEKRKEIAEMEIKEVLKEYGNRNGTDDIKIMIPDKEIQETVDSWIERTGDITISTDQLSDSEIEKILGQLSETSDLRYQMFQLLQEEEEKEEQAERAKRKIIRSLDEVKKELQGKGIENLENMNQGSYIQLKDGTIGERYWKIVDIDKEDLGNSSQMTIQMFDEKGQLVNSHDYPYDRFVAAIDAHLKSNGATVGIINERPAILTAPYENMESFQNWIDTVDKTGKGMSFQNGMSFSVQIDGTEEIYHVTKCLTTPVGRESFVLEDQYGNTYPKLSLEGFYDILNSSYNHHEYKRLGDFSTLENFTKSSKIIGLIYKDGKLEMASEHTGHDEHDHGHDAHKKTAPVWGFQNDDGSYMKAEFKGNQVVVTTYSKFKDSDNKVDSKTGESKRKESTKIKAEVYPPMTLDGFYSMLQKTKCLTPIEEDPRTKKIEEKHDSASHPHYHEQGIMGRLMGMKSIKDYGKMISMGTHMFEHMLEEQSRAHASEALYKTFSKTLGAEHAMTMHALMEFSGDISKLIEETIANLKKLEAGQRRKEIQHILLTKPPKPHKILAALIATADMAGHLYPDADLQEFQGEKYIWFEAVCEALGFDYKEEMKKAQEKGERFSKGNAGRLHETLLIERLFKQNHGKNPYIAAIGGGSKFWNAVAEGRNNQKSKGEKEVQQGLYGIDRAEYVVSKLESNEPEIAIGAYPGIYGKDPSAVNLGPAFVWALSNFPNTAHPETRNIFKNMMDANGVAFHALPFCKDENNAKIYKATLPVIIEKLGHSDTKYSGMLTAWKKVQSYNKGNETQTFQENHIKELWLFWKNYHRLIHPILQLSDPYIFTTIQDSHTSIEDASVLRSYVTTLGSVVKDGRLNDKGPEENIMKMGGYRFDGGSMIVDIDPTDNQKSIKRILNYLSPQSYTGVLGDVTQVTNIWEGQVLEYIKSIRENEHFINNPEYQKKQYIKIHNEVMTFLREKLTEGKYREVSKQPYIRQLQWFGFDTSEENIFKSSDFGGEMAFERFKNGVPYGIQHTQQHVQNDIRILTQGAANDERYDQRQAA